MAQEFTFTVNGIERTTTQNKPLLRYLRDDLHIHSAKDGCSEGACGTCTIHVDGAAVKACVLTTALAAGRNIVTVEGLPENVREAFVYAFGAVGAVQCGFCIPGMVMAGAALIAEDPEPTEEQIKYAIRGNVCRCTGYKKIIEGIALAAAVLRGEKQIDEDLERGDDYGVGKRAFRIDVRKKVLGEGKYPDDIDEIDQPGLTYASAVRSKYPRARVLSIDTSKAEALPGVVGILRAEDVPVNQVGHLIQDWDVMIAQGDITRCVGDAIVLVVAEDEATLEKAKKLVKIDYEPLEPVRNIAEARSADAPRLHDSFFAFGNTVELKDNVCQSRHVTRGDAAKALAESAFTVTQRFTTPFTEHAFLEPECAVAFPYKNGVKVQSTDQGAYDTRKECAHMFGWDNEPERVVVETMLVGGGFGGKEDVSVQHLAALAAYKLQRPVKCKLTRAESLAFHPKRHAMDGTFTLGCDAEGNFTGLDCEINFDTGAYASLCGPVLERACTHAAGPYAYENFEIDGYAYYTNNPPAGAFRGFGVTQTCFAVETLLNRAADLVGISPWEIRYRNAIRPGGVLPNGQIVDDSTGLVETLLAVKDEYDNAKIKGIACAMKNAGLGVGLPDWGRCKLIVEGDSKVHIYSGASCIGQGLGTVLVQMVCSNTNLSRDDIVYERSNTWIAPDSGDTSGSRQTLVTGEACRRACLQLHEALAGKSLSDLIGKEFYGEYLAKTDPLGADVPNPVSHVAYGYATQVCILDEKTGLIRKMIAAHDVGKAINPLSCEGQIEGGVVMSMGYALTEQYPIDENCRPTARFGTLGLFRAHQVPEIKAIVIDKPGLNVACGAIGIGEITSIPTAPAIADAYYRLDGEPRTSLPLTGTPYARK